MIRVLAADFYQIDLHTRIPFHYGIATLTETPHLIMRLRVDVDGKLSEGLAADNLVPKWFSKDAAQTYNEELAAMLDVISMATQHALQTGSAPTVFRLWQHVYAAQQAWAQDTPYPALLWQFGVSLVERALIDAFCKAEDVSFAKAIRDNRLGIDLGQVHAELTGLQPAQLLPASPAHTIFIRHTVGMADPLTEAEISPHERVNDGLPQSLEACIQTYGLRYFKIKIAGTEEDIPRLVRIAAIIETRTDAFTITLDGNEQFREVAAFRRFWERFRTSAAWPAFGQRLLFVEQPFHRVIALTSDTQQQLLNWTGRPPMIIDESDAELGSMRRALAYGYAGTSHKNCKGVFKGVANACLLSYLRQQQPTQTIILSGEDLSNVGPIALHQDLTVMATLGLHHVERNGHHYFGGLDQFPPSWQEAVMRHHSDLYVKHGQTPPRLRIIAGQCSLGSLLQAPFGLATDLDFSSLPHIFPITSHKRLSPHQGRSL